MPVVHRLLKRRMLLFDSATSFAMIRSGRMDATVIGAIQINEAGDLANWALPGKGVLGPGGAMDLVVGVKEVIVAYISYGKKWQA